MRNKQPNYWRQRRQARTKKTGNVYKVNTSKTAQPAKENFSKKYKANTSQKATGPFIDFDWGPLVKLVLILCFLFAVYFGIKKLASYVYALDIIELKSIEIVGIDNMSEERIRALLPFEIGQNIFSPNLGELENEILKDTPEIKGISIDRAVFEGGLNKIEITVKERQPEVFIFMGGVLKGLDFDNVPFVLYGKNKNLTLPTLYSKSSEDTARLLSFVKFLKPLGDDVLGNIKDIKISGADISFTNRDGTLVFWGPFIDKDSKYKFEVFRQIYLHAKSNYNKIEYIDMTLYLDGRAIIKRKD
jgi:cell division septal protein FtsQ